MRRSEADNQAAKQASLTAALLRQHRAVGRLIAGAKLAGPGAYRFEGMTLTQVIAAHEDAAKEPLMPRPKVASR